ncbi:MAG: transcriptional antiterminator, Rof [Thioalkalispiraceae bacterium]|jgi:Rho-binding antiterminator
MNEQNDRYIPVDCGLHSEYELAIMHRVMLQLVWTDAHDIKQQQSLIPVDLKTIDKKEYLIARTVAGENVNIRLDKILQSNVSEAIKP